MPKVAEDLTGKRFGWLTVVSRVENSPPGNPKWNCKCGCGGNKAVFVGNLKSGGTKSCGCRAKIVRHDRYKTKRQFMGKGPANDM